MGNNFSSDNTSSSSRHGDRNDDRSPSSWMRRSSNHPSPSRWPVTSRPTDHSTSYQRNEEVSYFSKKGSDGSMNGDGSGSHEEGGGASLPVGTTSTPRSSNQSSFNTFKTPDAKPAPNLKPASTTAQPTSHEMLLAAIPMGDAVKHYVEHGGFSFKVMQIMHDWGRAYMDRGKDNHSIESIVQHYVSFAENQNAISAGKRGRSSPLYTPPKQKQSRTERTASLDRRDHADRRYYYDPVVEARASPLPFRQAGSDEAPKDNDTAFAQDMARKAMDVSQTYGRTGEKQADTNKSMLNLMDKTADNAKVALTFLDDRPCLKFVWPSDTLRLPEAQVFANQEVELRVGDIVRYFNPRGKPSGSLPDTRFQRRVTGFERLHPLQDPAETHVYIDIYKRKTGEFHKGAYAQAKRLVVVDEIFVGGTVSGRTLEK